MEGDACEIYLDWVEPGDHARAIDECLHWRESTHRRAGHLGTDDRGNSHNRGIEGHRAANRIAKPIRN